MISLKKVSQTLIGATLFIMFPAVLFIIAFRCPAQTTDTLTTTSETNYDEPVIANWDSLTTSPLIVLPMPVNKTIRFALEGDMKGPGAVEINFPDINIEQVQKSCMVAIEAVMDKAQSIANGLGGDPGSTARQLVYAQLIIEQKDCLARIQNEVAKIMDIRAKCAVLRALEAQATATQTTEEP